MGYGTLSQEARGEFTLASTERGQPHSARHAPPRGNVDGIRLFHRLQPDSDRVEPVQNCGRQCITFDYMRKETDIEGERYTQMCLSVIRFCFRFFAAADTVRRQGQLKKKVAQIGG